MYKFKGKIVILKLLIILQYILLEVIIYARLAQLVRACH